jgi:hypothetical protein
MLRGCNAIGFFAIGSIMGNSDTVGTAAKSGKSDHCLFHLARLVSTSINPKRGFEQAFFLRPVKTLDVRDEFSLVGMSAAKDSVHPTKVPLEFVNVQMAARQVAWEGLRIPDDIFYGVPDPPDKLLISVFHLSLKC